MCQQPCVICKKYHAICVPKASMVLHLSSLMSGNSIRHLFLYKPPQIKSLQTLKPLVRIPWALSQLWINSVRWRISLLWKMHLLGGEPCPQHQQRQMRSLQCLCLSWVTCVVLFLAHSSLCVYDRTDTHYFKKIGHSEGNTHAWKIS